MTKTHPKLTNEFSHYKTLASEGDEDARVNLGLCYIYGHGVDIDPDQAVQLFRQAADNGNARGQSNLGFCYQLGKGVARDYDEAFRYYQMSTNQGLPGAKNHLANCYKNGWGVAVDLDIAEKLYLEAATNGDFQAQFNLGIFYRDQNRDRFAKNYRETVKWLMKAAENGSENAEEELQSLKKIGVPVESIKAQIIREEPSFFQTPETKEAENKDESVEANLDVLNRFLTSNPNKHPRKGEDLMFDQQEIALLKAQIIKNSEEITKMDGLVQTHSRMDAIKISKTLKDFYDKLCRDLYQTFSAVIVVTSGLLGLGGCAPGRASNEGTRYKITDAGIEFLKSFPLTAVLFKIKEGSLLDENKILTVFHISRIAQTNNREPSALCCEIASRITFEKCTELLVPQLSNTKSNFMMSYDVQVKEMIFREISATCKDPAQIEANKTMAQIMAYLFTSENYQGANSRNLPDLICKALGLGSNAVPLTASETKARSNPAVSQTTSASVQCLTNPPERVQNTVANPVAVQLLSSQMSRKNNDCIYL